MAKQDIETSKQDILVKLSQAGITGLKKTALAKNKSTKMAVEALEKNRLIVNLGSKIKTQYVLQEYNKPIEIASESILKLATGKMTLFSQSAFTKACLPGKVRQKVKDAIDWLVKEKKMFKFKYGKNYLFLHASEIQSVLPDQKTPLEKAIPAPELPREKVMAAYEKVKQRIGFSNVEIWQLQQELGVPMDILKEFIRKESREGRAVLSSGDWSLSSEETRSGAIELLGRPYLLVRFMEAR